jgi:hypothetical protein
MGRSWLFNLETKLSQVVSYGLACIPAPLLAIKEVGDPSEIFVVDGIKGPWQGLGEYISHQ